MRSPLPRKAHCRGDWVLPSEPSGKRRRSIAMAKAYWIVRVSVRDPQRYSDYLSAVGPAFRKFGARFIVRGGAFEAMEGTARERNVVIEFTDRPTAVACYNSDEYQRAKGIRQSCADADFINVDGFS